MSRSQVSSMSSASKAPSSFKSSVAGSSVSPSQVSPSQMKASNVGASSITPSTVENLSAVDLASMAGVKDSAPAIEEIVATSLKDRKFLALKMVGVGAINIPPMLKRQKLVISIIIHLMFSFNSLTFGVILYGTSKAMNDFCYNPVDPYVESNALQDHSYSCMPITPEGFVYTLTGKVILILFQVGCIIHTMSLAVGVFGCMYLNILCVIIFMFGYLLSYTLFLTSLTMEFFVENVGFPAYFDISQTILGFILSYVIFEMLMFATVVVIIIRWLGHLAQ